VHVTRHFIDFFSALAWQKKLMPKICEFIFLTKFIEAVRTFLCMKLLFSI